MKVFIAVLVIVGICCLCDPTRASPARVKRQGRVWSGDEKNDGPVRTTPPSRPVRTTRVTRQTEPAASSQYLACVAACQSTQQYNPICGSNRQTYDNIGKLKCANKCGANATTLFNGTCTPLRRK